MWSYFKGNISWTKAPGGSPIWTYDMRRPAGSPFLQAAPKISDEGQEMLSTSLNTGFPRIFLSVSLLLNMIFYSLKQGQILCSLTFKTGLPFKNLGGVKYHPLSPGLRLDKACYK